uniref:Retrotransposon gag domain-containing protein n=1 Tax=Cyprinus carpio carpio TaxID=630221 RepID=A0A9J8BJU2_CYPCA
MDSQERNLNDTGRAVQALVTQVSELTQQLQLLRAPTAPPTPAVPPAPSEAPSQPEPRLPIPESYSGEPNYCRAFLTRCDMHFSLQPRTFANERAKVAFVLTLLTGRAALWGTAVWENQDPCCASFQSLSADMRRVFDRAVAGREAARKLAELRQHEGSVSDYSIEFQTLAVECHWNEEAQWDMFLHGLADRVQKEIYALDLPTSLNGLIELALRVDARLTRMERRSLPSSTSWSQPNVRSSGGDAASPCIPLRPLLHHITVHALNGQKLPVISHVTEDITLITSGNHSETISFHILDSPLAPIVLGHPWLLLHNPKVDWSSNTILTWCQGCHESCLVSACPSVSMSVLQEEAVDLSNVPAEYLHLKEVFSKSRAASLPPHRPYDCAIELLSDRCVRSAWCLSVRDSAFLLHALFPVWSSLD